MSTITVLVQQMKLAASLATQGEWSYSHSGFNSIVQAPVALLRGGAARVVLCKLFRSEWRSELNTAHDAAFIALANPANVMELIGALEAREKQIAELVTGRLNLQRTMGGYVHAYEEAKSHIAELESRTVKLPERYSCELGYNSPDPNGDMLDRDDVLAMLASVGIQVIEGEA